MQLHKELFINRRLALTTDLFQQLDRCFSVVGLRSTPNVTTKSYTFSPQDSIDSLQADATVASLSVTLPSPVGSQRRCVIKTDSSANTVTVVGTINGVSSVILNYRYEYVIVEPTGTNWLIIGHGTLTPSFNSIAFPATQIPSADPNTLDDYEEGTWTPSVGGNATYTTQSGTYTKIGNLVSVQCRLTINVIGTGSTTTISGLPFASAAVTGGTVAFWGGFTTAVVFVGCITSGSTVQFTYTTVAAVGLNSPGALLQSGSDVIFQISYRV